MRLRTGGRRGEVDQLKRMKSTRREERRIEEFVYRLASGTTKNPHTNALMKSNPSGWVAGLDRREAQGVERDSGN